LLVAANIVSEAKHENLKDEADQLIRIVVTAAKKTKANNKKPAHH
jgi:hypothetical protein